MPIACDPEYIAAFSRVAEKIPGAACEFELADPGFMADPYVLAELYENNMDARDKKRTGAFYTPPEIVLFMCRESLANYISNCTGLSLDKVIAFINESSADAGVNNSWHEEIYKSIYSIDRALADIRIFDPSVGCGAFALGMLDEIARLRVSLTPFISAGGQSKGQLQGELQGELQGQLQGELQGQPPINADVRNPAQLLYEAIRNSIFAADTDQVSVEIAILSLWHRLTSALSHKTADEGAQIGITPHHVSENSISGFDSFEHNVLCVDSLFEYDSCDFDIVIGNPPYISAVEGTRNGKEVRLALREKFLQLSGAFDIYTAFLLDGIRKTNKNGVFCWIIPNKFLVSQYSAPVLDYLKQNGLGQSISVSDISVFTKARVYPIIIIGNKCSVKDQRDKPKSGCYSSDSSTEINAGEPGFIEYRADGLNDLMNRSFYPKTKVKTYKTFAEHNIKIASGAAGFQARSLSRYICDVPDDSSGKSDAINSGSIIPFVVSGCIGRYTIRYEKVRYMGTTYNKPYISKGREIADSKWNLWLGGKICIAGLTKEIQAYYSCRPLALGVGTYAIYEYGDFDPLFLLGVLNSSFMSRYIKDKFHERHLSGKYLAINKSMLEQLPIVQADREIQVLIGLKAGRLLELPPDCPEAELLSCEIDEIVGIMYGESDVW